MFQFFLLKPAPLYTLFTGLGNTNKSAASLLLSDSRSVSSPPSFLLSQTLWQIWQELSSLSSVLSGYNGSPDTCFCRGTTRLTCWPDGEHCLHPPQSLVVSFLSYPLLSFLGLETYCLIEVLRHRFPRFPPRNLCSLVMLTVFFLVFAATDTAFF